MGERFRLKASFDTSGYPKHARAILEGLKKYGMLVADNGSEWLMSISPDRRLEGLETLKRVKGSDFEAVDVSSLMVSPDSGEAKQPDPPQDPPPAPGGLRVSFWQWLSSRTVDCSSGVCTFK